jgi:hypothetical protein
MSSRIPPQSVAEQDLKTEQIFLTARETGAQRNVEWTVKRIKKNWPWGTGKVYRAQVYRELVYGIYCVHKRACSHWRRVLFFGYYRRFYLFTFVPAEIGEWATENTRFP